MKQILLVSFLLIISSTQVHSQLVNGGSVGGFTMDGDTKVGYAKFGTTTALAFHNDDWFLPAAYSGTGKGVLDTTGASVYKTKLQANQNIYFTTRMNVPKYTIVNNRLFLDALYTRDYTGVFVGNNSSNNTYDSTIFTVAAKNGENPNTAWFGGTAAIAATKTDLVNGMAHMRRDGPTVNDSLWMYFGVSNFGTAGTRYFDIELYKISCNYSKSTGRFSTAGTENGHSEWKFDASGNIIQTGDLIIAASFSPGSAPVLDIRIWVSTNTHTTVNPSKFDFNSVFDIASSGSVYGYAQIVSNSNTTGFGAGISNYSNISIIDTTFSTPWGTSVDRGSGAVWSENFDQLQFVETGINLTRIGVDPALYASLGVDPCSSFFESIFFKSRSSVSFTANSQDFMGPYPFLGNPSFPPVEVSANFPTLCQDNPISALDVKNPQSSAYYSWTTPNGIITSNPSGPSININGPGTYIAHQQVFAGCEALSRDTIIVVTHSGGCYVLPNNNIQIESSWQGNKALINWEIESALLSTSDKFIIERSTDNVYFTVVGEIAAVSTKKKYLFTDINCIAHTKYYYRVKVVEKNNSSSYSNSVLLKAPVTKGEISFFPNPAQHELNLYTRTSVQNAQAVIYDVSGAVIQQAIFSGNNLTMNVSLLKPGAYYLKVQQKDGSVAKMHKFVKL